ncbi:competence pheromone ComX [Calidifontibacillus oryziterrae]|uniref:competence pheromone ComX n=1 Tax=Calidifontibacillus oryziterrae TaxID=1191699 RepID=UPI0003080844|nr:competence pheromone ComX [Calidifontibacillus oryziterrae]
MLSDIIQFLVNNEDVVEKLQNGLVSLIGVSEEELRIILDVLTGTVRTLSDFWY